MNQLRQRMLQGLFAAVLFSTPLAAQDAQNPIPVLSVDSLEIAYFKPKYVSADQLAILARDPDRGGAEAGGDVDDLRDVRHHEVVGAGLRLELRQEGEELRMRLDPIERRRDPGAVRAARQERLVLLVEVEQEPPGEQRREQGEAGQRGLSHPVEQMVGVDGSAPPRERGGRERERRQPAGGEQRDSDAEEDADAGEEEAEEEEEPEQDEDEEEDEDEDGG